MTILEKSSTTNTTIASASYEAINALTFTSAEVADGNYLAVVTVDIDAPNPNSGTLNIAISQGGSITTHTEREIENETSHDAGIRRTMMIIAHINKTSGQALEVHWKRNAAGTWNALGRSFCLFPAASGDFTTAEQTGNSTLDNGTYTALPSSTFTTPASGDYLMNFTCSGFCPTDAPMNFAVFVGGSIIAHTTRSLGANSSFANVEECFLISAKVSPNGSQDVEIRWRRESGSGTITCMERSNVLLKLGTSVGLIEATGTADDSDSSTSDQIIDDMTISNPNNGEYLAIFGSYYSMATTGGEVITNSTFVATTEEADTDRPTLDDASNDGGDVPIATSGLVNPSGSQDITEHWQSDGTATRVMHERTLILLAEFEQAVFPIVVETTAISNQTSNATSKSDVTSPSGAVNNDIIIIAMAFDGTGAVPTSTDFATITQAQNPNARVEITFLWKRSSGSEPANYTVSWTGSEQARFMTVRVSGCTTSGDPWDVISSGVGNNASTTNVVDRLTSTVVDTLAFYGLACDRDRIDSGDTITGTGWGSISTSGSSGGANGAGLIVGTNEMASIAQVEAGTFGTWASDENASRGFNLKPPGVAPPAGVVKGIAMNPSAII